MKNEAREEALRKAQDQALVRREMIRGGVIRLAPEEEQSPETETRDRSGVLEEQVSR